MKFIKKQLTEYKVLMRSIPALVVCLFILSVVCMNLLANKELFSTKYLALDCGFTLSWISFLCMDIICKRYGPRAANKISLLALSINLLICMIFNLLSMTPGNWGEFYSVTDGSIGEIVNNALNTTIGGTWYVVLGSSIAMLVASLTNSSLNWMIGKTFSKTTYKDFAIRSFVSTTAAQFVDNLVFATLVSKIFFGWNWTQVILCSLTGAFFELLCEVVFSPIGFKISKKWEEEKVGQTYLDYIEVN